MKTIFVWIFAGISVVCGDIYLHNPRGSNNRLDEQGRERNNANRLFDSQNNNRGGYNVGSVYYYTGSKLQVEWTNQHSCNTDNNHCEIIVQYMCADTVRDGTTTATIPVNPLECKNWDCNTDRQYGMHEDYDYYLHCKLRQRNTGLFTADQNLRNRNRAINTRQNPNGNRRGYECPEERDYYPYWKPSPWKDIVVMTNDATRCPYYEQESQNVKSRWHCEVPRAVMAQERNGRMIIPDNQEDCEAFVWPEDDPEGVKGEWVEVASHNLPAPACMENQFSRDNHLGNGLGGQPLSFNWTVPDLPHDRCTMRIRYNISTYDYEAWDGVNATNNQPQRRRSFTGLDISSKYGFDLQEAAKDRGYEFKNNPQVEIFSGLPNLKFRLAFNTAQFGRTFQDRSHTFAIVRRPPELDEAVIHNVNVRGKRGNIVQVYPAVEYDFIPNTLQITQGQYIHYQWTGSNTNPHNNDGQGRAGTDRSNILPLTNATYSEGTGLPYINSGKYGHWGRSYPAHLDTATFLGLSSADMINLASLQSYQFRGEMSELDDAGTYFDLGPRKVTSTGTYHYLCTRNNNFSNRSQKGRVICSDVVMEQMSIGWNGGNLTLPESQAQVMVERGAFSELHNMRLEEWEKSTGEEMLEGEQKQVLDGVVSNYVVIHPQGRLTQEGRMMTVRMSVSPSSTEDVTIYQTSADTSTWQKVPAQIKDGYATFETDGGGTYVGVGHRKTAVIVGITIGVLAFVAIIVIASVIYFRKNPEAISSVRRTLAGKV